MDDPSAFTMVRAGALLRDSMARKPGSWPYQYIRKLADKLEKNEDSSLEAFFQSTQVHNHKSETPKTSGIPGSDTEMDTTRS
jgi:hypothetical protein